MSDDPRRYHPHRAATADRPLQGMTVLVVEDSRFASEAIRLLCQRSGARIRRADTLAAAHRHLAVYRPNIVIADIGLPDGTGAELLAELAAAAPRLDVLIGMSGDPALEATALAAGADGFLAKPVESLALFQQAILAHLPAGEGPRGPRALPNETVRPDRLALEDDLVHAAEIIGDDRRPLAYVAQFLGAVARSAHDTALEAAARRLAEAGPASAERARIAGLVNDRLAGLRAG
ncbi:response regulator [Sinisalibacter aestuarii]|uniref:Response regulator n=1 Tax=Sinisalibacter aestuarii TaxID=2949426 RepID=A0ABQ5LQ75_9RHOB|nr:response regulator [Sinisalibacter aestuarii]GKY86893.1 response regulator [Sinisalibacter aestuarii]